MTGALFASGLGCEWVFSPHPRETAPFGFCDDYNISPNVKFSHQKYLVIKIDVIYEKIDDAR